MHAHIVHPDPALEYAFAEEGCHILESWNDADDPQCSIARARVAPGRTTRGCKASRPARKGAA